MHQPGDIFEAHIARLQLFVIEHPHAALPTELVALEREVHLFDQVPFGAGAELGLRARRTAAEQDAVVWLHVV